MIIIKSLEELAISKAIEERTWLKVDNSFGALPKSIQSLLIEGCLKTKNTTAFEEFILSLRQKELVIHNVRLFTSDFAKIICNIISQKNGKWKETGICTVDFGGCNIGPVATNLFAKLILTHANSDIDVIPDQRSSATANKCAKSIFNSRRLFGNALKLMYNHHSIDDIATENEITIPEKIKISLHILYDNMKCETFQNIIDALTRTNVLQPYSIKAECLGYRRICQLLDVIIKKELPLFEVNFPMNSLTFTGIIEISKRLVNFNMLRKLNLAYAMISWEDTTAIGYLKTLFEELKHLEYLNLSSMLLEFRFVSLLRSIHMNEMRQLNLASCGLTHEAMETLADVLKGSKISVLKLQYNNLNIRRTFQAFIRIVEQCRHTLTELNIRNTSLDYDRFKILENVLLKHRTIMALRFLYLDAKHGEYLSDDFRFKFPYLAIFYK